MYNAELSRGYILSVVGKNVKKFTFLPTVLSPDTPILTRENTSFQDIYFQKIYLNYFVSHDSTIRCQVPRPTVNADPVGNWPLWNAENDPKIVQLGVSIFFASIDYIKFDNPKMISGKFWSQKWKVFDQ